MPSERALAEKQLSEFGKRLEPCLSAFLDAKIEAANRVSPVCGEMISLLREFTMRGGKRIRPALIYYAYKCFESDREEQVVYASMSIELLHSYLLIHDDVMDGDGLRRGRPALHKLYEMNPIATNYRSAEEFGIAMAITAGDLASALAVEVLARADFPPEKRVRALQKFSEIWTQVGHGQALDVASSCSDEMGEEEALLTNELKTACYTVLGPLHLGGILAGAADEELAGLKRYAMLLGQAFQMRDDILGLFGDEAQVGKPIGSDLKEGKKTVLILRALKLAEQDESSVIHRALGNPDLTASDVAGVQEVVRTTGALDYCEQFAATMVEEAKRALPESLLPDGRDFLVGIADYLVDRRS